MSVFIGVQQSSKAMVSCSKGLPDEIECFIFFAFRWRKAIFTRWHIFKCGENETRLSQVESIKISRVSLARRLV
jgi:hypothetical protein